MDKSVDLTNLFNRIEELGINSKIVAEATGISAGNISDWKKGRSYPTASKMIVLADYLGCSIDYLVGRTDVPRPLNVPKEFADKIGSMTDDFISEDGFVHPPFMSNRVYFIHEKDEDKIWKMYDKAKAFDETIIDRETFTALLDKYDNPLSRAAKASGYSITPRNYVEFKKVYDTYVDSCFNDLLNKFKK